MELKNKYKNHINHNVVEKNVVGFDCHYCNDCKEILSHKTIKHENKGTSIHDKNISTIKNIRTNKQSNRKQISKQYKTKTNIKNIYNVKPVKQQYIREWLLKKHYAKRIPPIKHCFGLYDKQGEIHGVCTFGMPARNLNDGGGCFGGEIIVEVLELNRLVVNEGLIKNVLSYFVSNCLKQLKKPVCIVSYADENKNHHGYIYQATNWYYTGQIPPMQIFVDTRNGKTVHQRTIVSRYGSSAKVNIPDYIEVSSEESAKHRYFMFLGNKSQVKNMIRKFKYEIKEYPKGDNERYDASYEVEGQMSLF